MTVIELLLIFLILAATVLCIYIILTLKKITARVDDLQKDLKQVTDSLVPLLNNLNEVSSKVNRIVLEVENYWDEIDNSSKNVKERISGLKRFRDAENPTSDLIKNLRAYSKAFLAFWNEFKRR